MTERTRGHALLACLLLACLPAAADDAMAGLRAAIAIEKARPVPDVLPRAAFLSQPQVQAVTLAPDGRHLAWLEHRGEHADVWLQRLPHAQAQRHLPRTGATALAWSADGGGLLVVEPGQLAWLPLDGARGGTRLSALGGVSRRQFLGVDPTRPGAALVIERPARRNHPSGVWRVLSVSTDGERMLAQDTRQIVDVALDAGGALDWRVLAVGEQHEWHLPLEGGGTRRVLACGQMRQCRLVGRATDGGAWLWGNPDGDLVGLRHIDRDGRLGPPHLDPAGDADLADLVLDPRDGQPRLLGWRSTVPRRQALDAPSAARLAHIEARLPDRELQFEIGGDAWLVQERSDVLRGTRWWLSGIDGSLEPLLTDRGLRFSGQPVPRPAEATMARKRPVRWQASDGRWLHGFVHLPPGRDVASAPLVVLVHGGPYSLVRPDFSSDAQLLANRGYVVFQPNFRGSTGLGRTMMLAANGDFGRGRVLADIVDGTRWLLDAGVGDPRRVAIAGASFGGYAALLGASHEPALFQAAIAAVPPTDFGRVVREYQGSGHEMLPGIPMAASMRHLGMDPSDDALMRRLEEQSPIAAAATLRRPVLLVAGGQDERVPIRGVTHYAALLRTLDKPVTLFVDGQAGHGIADDRSREAYYFLMERFLHQHLGGPAPAPPDAALREHLRRHLKLDPPGAPAWR